MRILIMVISIIVILKTRLFGQDSLFTGKDFVIECTSSLVEKKELASGWQVHLKDTISPTLVRGDFNCDGVEDFCGFYAGVSCSLVLGSMEKGEPSVYQVFCEPSWYRDNTWRCLLELGLPSDKILSKGNEPIELNCDYVKMINMNGDKFAIVFNGEQFDKIRIW
jgi:hypothetical protein